METHTCWNGGHQIGDHWTSEDNWARIKAKLKPMKSSTFKCAPCGKWFCDLCYDNVGVHPSLQGPN